MSPDQGDPAPDGRERADRAADERRLDDRDLADAFARLRAEDARVAPDFTSMMIRAEAVQAERATVGRTTAGRTIGPQRRALRWTLAGAGLAAAAAGVLFFSGLLAEARFQAAVASVAALEPWGSVTDPLMDVPGASLMGSPRLLPVKVWMGVADSGLPVPDFDVTRATERNRS